MQVRADSLTPEALLTALKAGHYYASEGPEIHAIVIEDEQIAITASADCSICATGPHSGGRFHSTNTPLASTTSPIHGQQGTVQYTQEDLITIAFPRSQLIGPYCRVTITDAVGKHAWSNLIWLA